MRHNESRIQTMCVGWFRLTHPALSRLYFSIPNGMLTSQSQARIAVAEGLLKGAADTFLAYPSGDYHGLFVEFKQDRVEWMLGSETHKRTYQSQEQKLFQQEVERVGYRYEVVRTKDEFEKLINDYLK